IPTFGKMRGPHEVETIRSFRPTCSSPSSVHGVRGSGSRTCTGLWRTGHEVRSRSLRDFGCVYAAYALAYFDLRAPTDFVLNRCDANHTKDSATHRPVLNRHRFRLSSLSRSAKITKIHPGSTIHT